MGGRPDRALVGVEHGCRACHRSSVRGWGLVRGLVRVPLSHGRRVIDRSRDPVFLRRDENRVNTVGQSRVRKLKLCSLFTRCAAVLAPGFP